jgi:hypothetical protein
MENFKIGGCAGRARYLEEISIAGKVEEKRHSVCVITATDATKHAV